MDISVASFGIAAPERDPATSEVLIGALNTPYASAKARSMDSIPSDEVIFDAKHSRAARNWQEEALT
jgi:hypothetical protein